MNLFFVLLLFLFFVGCSNEADEANKLGSKAVRLKYWCAPNAEEIELARMLVDKWNKLHPTIQVEVQPLPAGQSSEEVLLAAIAGGTTPDVCSNIWPGAVAEYVKAGGLVPLDEFPDFDSVITARKVTADLLESMRSKDGHFYQLPWKTNPVMLLYNVKILKKSGVLSPPRTYSEFFEACEKIKKIGVWPGYTDIRPIWWQRFFDFYPFYIAATGGKTLFDKGEFNIDYEGAAKVFNFFQMCYKKGYFPITSFQVDPFLTGKIAMRFTGPWTIAYFEKNKPFDFEYDFAPIPAPDDYKGKIYTYGDPKNIAIFSSTKYKKEAWEFVKFLISEEADLLLLEIANQLPIRGDLLENEKFADYFKRNPKMKKFAEQSSFIRGVDEMVEMKEIFDAISREFEACAVYGVKSPREAVNNLVKRINVVVEWSK
jgi:multiple sugar transport system substrate-binding protein